MIFEMRTYTIRAGKVAAYLDHYEKEGLETQSKYLGQPFGYFFSEIGDLTKIVHIWRYESLADRDERRARLRQDPEWTAYLKSIAEHQDLVDMKNAILKPAPFFNPG